MAADGATTWILTAVPGNHAATADHGFTVIGGKERRRNHALLIGPGDRIVLYLTRVMRCAAAIRVTSKPAEHWKLSFRGQLRTVSDAGAAPLMERMHAAAGVCA